ncbi:ammonium transporter [Bacillus cereus group sp. BfR-BA-00331]|uniref:ammonium transporter n=1 Tax=Bacillus cereus group TaxID=86661 RepID=UPI0007721FE7|nr:MULTISPECIES: ammonium transporter [Bacillus cereus group]ONG65058.1 ammonia channel protein [Bacillus cereus]MDA2193378.1 ammonium transporter [Bacillus cereus group sp. Bc238]MDA2199394.1 ammonium transporter [Bacillus cereus group sp. Bc237]MDA2662200.1 ammonium transporter [Bacillus cereus group sp. Bc032]MDA2672923.1 ammonium transporter [Bacillus cereus group sp. Bc031]
MNTGDTVFMFVATVMVMLMTPGLALFYGGMVRSKNVLSTTMHSYSAMAIVSIQWIVIGYSLSFGPDWHGLIGTFDWFGLNGVSYAPNPDYSSTIPHNLFMMFQLMFAILTPALISGAFAERMRFSAFLIFILLWTTIVYNPVAHWVWGVGGWLRELGALDFAGGNVVHITSGVAGLVLAIFLGKRKNINGSSPHHLPFTMLGAGLLWFGWFGFNVGSALSLNDVALTAFINTNIAAAASALTWMLSEWFFQSKPTAMGAACGVVSGLVAITPACGFVTPFSALLIGAIGGVLCFGAVFFLKTKFGYDDTLDAFGCHGIGGTWGGIATGLFATTTINSDGANGLFYGNAALLLKQLVAIGATYAFTIIMTYAIIKAINFFLPVRVDEHEEHMGLDISMHGEKAYEYTERVN